MRVFVRIVDEGTFAQAATSLQVPRATTSKLIQDLEAHLGVRLLHRTTRRIEITPEGAAYYDRATRILGAIDELDAETSTGGAVVRGHLRVEASSAIANAVLIPALPSFLVTYPELDLELRIVEQPGSEIERVDCALRVGSSDGSAGGAPNALWSLGPGVAANKVADLPWVTCASEVYLNEHGSPQTPQELEREHGIVQHLAPNGRPRPLRFEQVDADGQVESLEVLGEATIAVSERGAHMAAIAAGLGIGQTLKVVAAPHLAAGRVIMVLPAWSRPPLPLLALCSTSRQLSGKVRTFIAWTRDVFANAGEGVVAPRAVRRPRPAPT